MTGVGFIQVQQAQKVYEVKSAQVTAQSESVDCFTTKSENANTEVQIKGEASKALEGKDQEATANLQDATKSLSCLSGELNKLTGELTQYTTALDDAKKSGDKSAIAKAEAQVEQKTKEIEAKQKEVETAQQNVTNAAKNAEVTKSALQGAQVAQNKAEAANTEAQDQLAKANEQLKTGTAAKTTAENNLAQAEHDAKVAAEVKESGVVTVKDGNKTITKNDASFDKQEAENIKVAKEIKEKYSNKNSVAIENSLIDDEESSRAYQCKKLAEVNVVPNKKSNPIDATRFEDSVHSGENGGSAATSVIRNKSDAVDLYLKANGIENATPADKYAAEYAVSALQAPIVENAKKAETLESGLRNGTASDSDRTEYAQLLKAGMTNGVPFEDNGKTTIRTVGDNGQKFEDGKTPLMTTAETNALIQKLESGSTDFTQREINAINFLKGNTDNQGFPTVPANMEWVLPDSVAEYANKMKEAGPSKEAYVEADPILKGNGNWHLHSQNENGKATDRATITGASLEDPLITCTLEEEGRVNKEDGTSIKHNKEMLQRKGAANSNGYVLQAEEAYSDADLIIAKYEELEKRAGGEPDGIITYGELEDAGIDLAKLLHNGSGIAKQIQNDPDYKNTGLNYRQMFQDLKNGKQKELTADVIAKAKELNLPTVSDGHGHQTYTQEVLKNAGLDNHIYYKDYIVKKPKV